MTEPPRRLAPTPAQRVEIAIERQAGGVAGSDTRYSRRVEPRPDRTYTPTVVFVNHGTDSTVERPDAALVFWRGTATPDNIGDNDFILRNDA